MQQYPEKVEDERQEKLFSSLRSWRKRVSGGMDAILPGLFVGGLRDALDGQQLQEQEIAAVVSVHDFCNDYDFTSQMEWIRIRLSDSPEQDASIHFATVNSFVHKFRMEQKNVLIHCLAGASRSVCFIVAYLMTVTNLDYASALAYVVSKRPSARPNFGFRMQLRKFGEQSLAQERKRLLEEFKEGHKHFFALRKHDCLASNSLYVSLEGDDLELDLNPIVCSPRIDALTFIDE
uniref:Dual specificity protein phosphatase n=1 Tax=Ditylenchus dipsaci TaxID=166011 RepID=A0A915EHP4_9BILA